MENLIKQIGDLSSADLIQLVSGLQNSGMPLTILQPTDAGHTLVVGNDDPPVKCGYYDSHGNFVPCI